MLSVSMHDADRLKLRFGLYATPVFRCGAKARRRAKIAAAKRGKPRAPATVAKMRAANLGKRLAAETRGKMSKAHRARGTRPPWRNPAWTAAEDALLPAMSKAEAARQIGRSMQAVYVRRHLLGLPDGRRKRSDTDRRSAHKWPRLPGDGKLR